MGRSCFVVLVIASSAGCLSPSYQTCGDVICPTDSVCLSPGECVSSDAVAACSGVADGTACKTSLFDGACIGGACRVPRCGDGIVEPPEQCDGPIPAGVDCVDYGFDLGAPSCSPVCTLDVIDSCIRFGWRRVLSVLTNSAWTDGTRFAVVPADQQSVQVYVGAQLVLTGTSADGAAMSGVWGKGPTIVAWTDDEDILISSNGGAFVPFDTSNLPNSEIDQVAIADDGSLYVLLIDQDCQIFEAKPGLSLAHIYTNADPAACGMIDADGGQVLLSTVSGNAGAVLSWNGTTWSTLFTTPSNIMDLESGGGAVWAGTSGDGAYRYVNGTATQYSDQEIPQVLPVGNDIYLCDGATTERILDGVYDELASPIDGWFLTDGTHIYTYGAGIYEWTGLDYSDRFGLSGVTQSIALLGDGTVAMAIDGEIYQPDNHAGWNTATTSAGGTSIAGANANDIYVSDDMEIDHFNGTTVTAVTPPPLGTSAMTAIWAPPSGSTALYVVGTNQLAYSRSSAGAWTAISAPPNATGCNLTGLSGSGTTVIAVGACGTQGIVWQLSGHQWDEIYRGPHPLAGITIDAAGDVFAAGPNGGAHSIGGTWTEDDAAIGLSIAATGPNDIWVAGGPDEVIHWDGTAWSRLGVLGAASPRVVATTREVFFVGTTQSSLLR